MENGNMEITENEKNGKTENGKNGKNGKQKNGKQKKPEKQKNVFLHGCLVYWAREDTSVER